MNWENQLSSMIEAGHLDPDYISDLWVAYAAETGDATLIGAAISCIFTLYQRPGGLAYVDDWHYHWKTDSCSVHRSHSFGLSSRCSSGSLSSTRSYSVHSSGVYVMTGSASNIKSWPAMDGSVSAYRKTQF